MEKPKPPLCRIIRDGTIGSCPDCGSTEERKYNLLSFSFGKIIGCINPECENYYEYKSKSFKKIKSKIDEILKLNPEKFYVKDIMKLFGINMWFAKKLCDMAVKDGKFIKNVEIRGTSEIEYYQLKK